MASETTANVAAMATAAGQVDEAIGKVSAVRGGVRGTMSNAAVGWQTDASVKFQQAMDQWDQDFQKIIDGLTRIQEALGGTRNAYSAAQDAEQSSVDPIISALNPS